jgi:hypothetical protein
MTPPQAFMVTLAQEDWEIVERALVERPYHEVAVLMERIGEQLRAQWAQKQDGERDAD